MANKRNNDSLQRARRTLLKKSIVGAGVMALLPERWTRPVVQSVVLPAHAQATQTPIAFTQSGITFVLQGSMLDMLVKPAYASFQTADLCANTLGNSADLLVLIGRLVAGQEDQPQGGEPRRGGAGPACGYGATECADFGAVRRGKPGGRYIDYRSRGGDVQRARRPRDL